MRLGLHDAGSCWYTVNMSSDPIAEEPSLYDTLLMMTGAPRREAVQRVVDCLDAAEMLNAASSFFHGAESSERFARLADRYVDKIVKKLKNGGRRFRGDAITELEVAFRLITAGCDVLSYEPFGDKVPGPDFEVEHDGTAFYVEVKHVREMDVECDCEDFCDELNQRVNADERLGRVCLHAWFDVVQCPEGRRLKFDGAHPRLVDFYNDGLLQLARDAVAEGTATVQLNLGDLNVKLEAVRNASDGPGGVTSRVIPTISYNKESLKLSGVVADAIRQLKVGSPNVVILRSSLSTHEPFDLRRAQDYDFQAALDNKAARAREKGRDHDPGVLSALSAVVLFKSWSNPKVVKPHEVWSRSDADVVLPERSIEMLRWL